MQTLKYAIVTGAASGLGRAITLELARRGWHIAVADMNPVGREETVKLARQAGGQATAYPLDVTKPDEWLRLREQLRTAWPQLDLLVNNAGVGVSGEVGKLPLEDWKWIIDINLYGAIYGCHTLIGWMKENSHGSHIVNIASMAAIASAPGMAPYNITKAGMVSLSETLYGELKPYNIGVTGVCPAFFPTNILENGRFQTSEQKKAAAKFMDQSRCTAEHVAKKIMRAVDKRQLYVFVPGAASFFWRLKRLMPVRLLNLVARRHAKLVAAKKV